jgi:hypothetical protein
VGKVITNGYNLNNEFRLKLLYIGTDPKLPQPARTSQEQAGPQQYGGRRYGRGHPLLEGVHADCAD